MKTLNAFFESERFTGTLNVSSAPKLHCFIFVSSLWFSESKFPFEILGKLRSLTTIPRKSVRSADPCSLSSRFEPATCSLAVVMTNTCGTQTATKFFPWKLWVSMKKYAEHTSYIYILVTSKHACVTADTRASARTDQKCFVRVKPQKYKGVTMHAHSTSLYILSSHGQYFSGIGLGLWGSCLINPRRACAQRGLL